MNLRKSTRMRLVMLALTAAMLKACVSAPTRPIADTVFNDALFAPLAAPIQSDAAFAMTPAMRQYAETVLKPRMRHAQPEQALIDALYEQGQLKLEYDAALTRNAADAFAARTGNCLSLVLMTGAFAEHFGMTVHYQEVFVREHWSRSGALAMANRHVNLRFDTRADGAIVSFGEGRRQAPGLTVDFLPSEQAGGHRARVISRETVRAMYLNNRAAELLAADQPAAAYWWVREAIRKVPAFTDSYNLLGVIYQRAGDLASAEASLRKALALEPDNTIPMSNLVDVLIARGQHEAAQQLAAQLAAIEPFPPFYFYDQGLAALRAGDFARAREMFQREVNRDAGQADSYFGLGLASFHLGDLRRARRQLARAIEHSTTVQARAIYSSKLDWLKSQGDDSPRQIKSASQRTVDS